LPTQPTLLSFFFNEREILTKDNLFVEVASTSNPHTLDNRNCQRCRYKLHTASLRTPATNRRSGSYTASLGGGLAHAGGSYRRPNRRPFYACCRNQNETVALFCKVKAKHWCLLAEPSPCGGTTIHHKDITYQSINYYRWK
jgi:hypothetical protein